MDLVSFRNFLKQFELFAFLRGNCCTPLSPVFTFLQLSLSLGVGWGSSYYYSSISKNLPTVPKQSLIFQSITSGYELRLSTLVMYCCKHNKRCTSSILRLMAFPATDFFHGICYTKSVGSSTISKPLLHKWQTLLGMLIF